MTTQLSTIGICVKCEKEIRIMEYTDDYEPYVPIAYRHLPYYRSRPIQCPYCGGELRLSADWEPED